ncbi:MAG: TetR/AcrR family transcriptional regulator [Polyangiaceae bacterium]|nr:TetR/AcrR family transcriptional regulator [Myxococcales bacterium]MCB9590458.1 TetR/AcrR family transcriptional regulator [Polyangiaceae bacterium]MCB9608451.1 TetR/AcrR family transcriptional regulator [Polyangiaceae bacterium]
MSKTHKKSSRAYKSPLREAQAEATRERVVEAAIRLIAKDPTTFTIPGVAKSAGVSQPTVYRLFPDKESLTDAAREAVRKRAGVDPSPSIGSEDLIKRQIHSILRMSKEPPEVLGALGPLNSAQLSDAGLQERHAYIATALREELRGVPTLTRRRVIHIINMLYSSSGAGLLWRYHLMNEEGADSFAWLCRALIEAAQREGKK